MRPLLIRSRKSLKTSLSCDKKYCQKLFLWYAMNIQIYIRVSQVSDVIGGGGENGSDVIEGNSNIVLRNL